MEKYEELVSYLTPRQENDAIRTFQNTTAIACPACDDPFDDLVVVKQDPTSLTFDEPMDLCVSQFDGRPALFTHKR